VLEPGGKPHRAKSTDTMYAVSGLVNGTQYSFVITTLSAAGDGATVRSNTVTPATIVPDAPKNISVIAGDNQVDVTWDAPTNAQSGGYTVDIVPEAGGTPITRTVAGNQNSTNIPGLVNGTTYHAVVRATVTSGASGPPASSQTFIPRGRPGTPGTVTASVSVGGQVTVTWIASAANGTPVTSYTITAPGVPTQTEPGDRLSTIVRGLTVGSSYTFSVVATNAVGNGAPGVAPAVVVQSQVPDAPTNVTATPGDGMATISWNAPNGNGTNIDYYLVRTGGQSRQVTGTSFDFTGLTNGTAYTFDVQAVGANGSTSVPGAANPAGVVPVAPAGVPEPPVILDTIPTSPTTIDVLISQVSPSNGTIVNQWQITTTPASTTRVVGTGTATLTGLLPSTSYQVRVIGIGTNGFNSGVALSLWTPTPAAPPPPPSALTGLTRWSRSLTLVDYSWNASTGADNYRIDYQVVPGGTLKTITVQGNVLRYKWAHGGSPGDTISVTVTPVSLTAGDGNGASATFTVPEPIDPCVKIGQICP
jgi:titin